MRQAIRDSLKNGSSLLRRLPLDRVTQGWAVIFSGTLARMALSFLTGILIVRTFGPEDFGIYSLLTAVVGIVGVVIDVGLTEAAVKGIAAAWSNDRPAARRQAQVFFWLRLGLAVFGVTLGILLAWPISRYILQLPDNGWLLSLALLGVITTALNGAVNAILQGTSHFGRISTVLVTSSALALLLAGGLALSGTLTLTTALVGISAGTALAGFLVGRRLLPLDWGQPGASPLRFPGLIALRRAAPRLLRFGSWLWLANIFKTLIAYLDFFLINLWLAPATVGLYALALGLASRVETVNHSLYTVLIPMASSLKDRQALLDYLRQGFKRSALISLALVGLGPVAIWFIPFFYGEAFRPAVTMFQLLLGVTIFDIFTLPALLLIYTFDRSDLSALAEGFRVVILLLVALWLIPLWGPVGAIIAKFIAKVGGVLLTFGLLWRHYRVTQRVGNGE